MRIMKIMEIIEFQKENHENHENYKITLEIHKNYDNPIYQCENNENH